MATDQSEQRQRPRPRGGASGSSPGDDRAARPRRIRSRYRCATTDLGGAGVSMTRSISGVSRRGLHHVQLLDRHPLDELRRSQRLDAPDAAASGDAVLLGQQLLGLFHPIAVLLQRRTCCHAANSSTTTRNSAEADRAPHVPMALEIDLADDRIVPNVLLDGPLERFAAHADPPSLRPSQALAWPLRLLYRAQLGAAGAGIALDFRRGRNHRSSSSGS